jgi:hypothetical protein
MIATWPCCWGTSLQLQWSMSRCGPISILLLRAASPQLSGFGLREWEASGELVRLGGHTEGFMQGTGRKS